MMEKAKCLMVYGTDSNAGESSITLALVKWLSSQGALVLPFKPMSWGRHSYRTASGGELHVHQAQQAVAAGLEPCIDMNPVMLETGANGEIRILLRGQPLPDAGMTLAGRVQLIRSAIAETYQGLEDHYDFILLEGCGKPGAWEGDLAELRIGQTFDVPCVLVASAEDEDIVGSLAGTLGSMNEAERARIIGFIVNKLHGTFADSVRILENRTGLPCLGAIPFMRGLQLIGADRSHDGDITSSTELVAEIERWTEHVIRYLDIPLLKRLAFGRARAAGADLHP